MAEDKNAPADVTKAAATQIEEDIAPEQAARVEAPVDSHATDETGNETDVSETGDDDTAWQNRRLCSDGKSSVCDDPFRSVQLVDRPEGVHQPYTIPDASGHRLVVHAAHVGQQPNATGGPSLESQPESNRSFDQLQLIGR